MRNRLLISLLLILATLAVFWPASGFEFVSWDDGLLVYENSYLKPPSVDNTLHYWKNPKWLYMPLTYTVWSGLAWLSQQFPMEPYGVNPHLFHTANIIVHLLSVLVVFSILKMVLLHGFREGADDGKNHDSSKVAMAAGIGALIFALHPVQVEPVAWVSDLKDLLCGLFSFVAIREYLAYAFASSGKGGANKKIHYILACAAFLLALLSKPTAVIVPLVLVILDRWAVKRSMKEIAYSLAGWFIIAAVFAVIAKSVQQTGYSIVTTPLWARPFIAGDSLAFYLYKLVFPLHLGIDYGRTPGYVLTQWWGYATWLFPFALVGIVWFLKQRKPLLVSFGIFAAALLPVLGFTPFLFQNYSTVADHYLYIPMLGVAMTVSWTVLNVKTKFVMSLSLLVILLFGIRSSLQLSMWSNENTLFINSLKVNPESVLSNYSLGNILKKQGKLDAAIYHYKAAVEIRPFSIDVNKNLGVALTEMGNLEEAVFYFEKVIKYSPTDPDAHNNLGVVLDKLGRPDEAAVLYKKALRIKPDDANAHNNLAIVLEAQGKLDEAVFHYKKSLEIRPGIANTHFNLGNALVKLNKPKEAITHFSHALRIRPQFNPAKKQLAIAKAKLENR